MFQPNALERLDMRKEKWKGLKEQRRKEKEQRKIEKRKSTEKNALVRSNARKALSVEKQKQKSAYSERQKCTVHRV